ncbi:MAG: hypothetical protein ACJ79H_20600 [Myxococcales bacterium]
MAAADVRVILAGLSARLATELRSGQCQVERTRSEPETMRSLRRPPAPRLLVVSEMLPRAGDVVAAVEADPRLAALVLVALVGDRTALASALRSGGLRVLSRRKAGEHLKRLLRSPETAFHSKWERCVHLSRARTQSSQRHVRRSRMLIEQSRRLCARFTGGADRAGGAYTLVKELNAEP